MITSTWSESLLAAGALSSSIVVLGAIYLLILRTPKAQFSVRFLVLTIGCIAVALGLWTAVLRKVAMNPAPQETDDQSPSITPSLRNKTPELPGWTEPMDGLYVPKPVDQHRPSSSEPDSDDPQRIH